VAQVWYRARDLAEALRVLEARRPVLVSGGTDLFAWAVGARQCFLRLDQRGGTDISIVSAAVVLEVEDGRIRRASIAVGAAGPVPFGSPRWTPA
jgi:CO/xanthine dehydrogenase FAD-binding subunit